MLKDSDKDKTNIEGVSDVSTGNAARFRKWVSKGAQPTPKPLCQRYEAKRSQLRIAGVKSRTWLRNSTEIQDYTIAQEFGHRIRNQEVRLNN
jgi:hypothetical protein